MKTFFHGYIYSIPVLVSLTLLSGCTYNRAMAREGQRSVYIQQELGKEQQRQSALSNTKRQREQQRNRLIREVNEAERQLAGLNMQLAKLSEQNRKANSQSSMFDTRINQLGSQISDLEIQISTSETQKQSQLKIQEKNRLELQRKVKLGAQKKAQLESQTVKSGRQFAELRAETEKLAAQTAELERQDMGLAGRIAKLDSQIANLKAQKEASLEKREKAETNTVKVNTNQQAGRLKQLLAEKKRLSRIVDQKNRKLEEYL